MNNADAYHEALSSHRHYDGMANKALSLAGAAMAAGPTLYGSVAQWPGAELILVFAALVIYLSVQTYRRFDRYAVIALNVAAAIEEGDARFVNSTLGFAKVFSSIDKFRDLDAAAVSRTFKQLRFVGYSTTALFLLAALAIAVSRMI